MTRNKLRSIGRLFSRNGRFKNPIIVVSGLPRSGTSMMMKALEAGGLELMVDHLREADEDNPKGYFELEKVKELQKTEDKSWLAAARGKGVKIISYLLKELPPDYEYKVIFMDRDLDEIEASQQKMLVRRGEPVGETDSEAMKKTYTDHLRKMRRWLSTEPHFDHLDVRHKDFLDHPLTESRRVKRFLSMELDVRAMAAVIDRGLYRNRR